jgi:hypothetical protein
MNVSMDGLRKRLVSDYNSLTRKLNRGVNDDSWNPEIVVNPESIEREMESLRNAIITLAFCSMDGVGGFQELDENTHFESFMPEVGE